MLFDSFEEPPKPRFPVVESRVSATSFDSVDVSSVGRGSASPIALSRAAGLPVASPVSRRDRGVVPVSSLRALPIPDSRS